MKYDVAIILPSIRPENLVRFYNSALKACKSNTFQIIIPSPYLIPKELMATGNVTFLHTYANPTISFQTGALLSNSEFLYNVTDDGLIQENVIDLAIEKSKTLDWLDMINMIYNEGVLNPDTFEYLSENQSNHPPQYWLAYYHADLRLKGINPNWKLCMHFFIKSDYFFRLGGFDCQFEYSNHALHDLAFRAQANGSNIYELEKTAFLCSHLPGKTGDHGPVHDAQTGPDTQYFNELYRDQKGSELRKIEYNNWKNYANIWERRFGLGPLPISKL